MHISASHFIQFQNWFILSSKHSAVKPSGFRFAADQKTAARSICSARQR